MQQEEGPMLDIVAEQRGQALTKAFQDAETNMIKQAKGDAQRKNKWLSQLITFRRVDGWGKCPARCEWKVERRKMTTKLVQDLVRRSPLPCEIDFFIDSNGDSIYLNDLQMKGMGAPMVYTVVPVPYRKPEDAKNKDPHFVGETVFVIMNVPNWTRTRGDAVTSDMVEEYVLFAMSEVDPVSLQLLADIDSLEHRKISIDKRMAEVPALELLDLRGRELTLEEAEAEREVMYKALGDLKHNCDVQIAEKRQTFDEQRGKRKAIGLGVKLFDTDAQSDTSSWLVSFSRHPDGQYFEEKLLKKSDWQNIHMCAPIDDAEQPHPAWAGRGAVPDGSKEFMPDYTLKTVNMQGVFIKRIAHNVGNFISIDDETSPWADSKFAYYTGEIFYGKRHGSGVSIDDTGIYSGKFEMDHRMGLGRWDAADGLNAVGTFGNSELFKSRHKGEFANPYLGDDLHGYNVDIMFPDGALYRGEMRNGVISGRGEYESAFGEVMDGHFENGIMHGKGTMTNSAGETFSGTWTHGALNGMATYENKFGDSYYGSWKHSLYHGRGVAKYRALGEYKGFWRCGMRSGKGEMDVLPRYEYVKKEVDLEAKVKLYGEMFLSRYQGHFLAGKFQNGGMVMDTVLRVPIITSRRSVKAMRHLVRFDEKLQASITKMTKVKYKMAYLEQYMRTEIERRKRKIFEKDKEAIKHQIKQETVNKLDAREISRREKTRKFNLKHLEETTLRPTKALVPWLQLKEAMPATHLSKTLASVDYSSMDNKRNPDALVASSKLDLQKLAVTTMEGTIEKQRFIKYDNVWALADKDYIDRQKALAAERAAAAGAAAGEGPGLDPDDPDADDESL